MQTLLKVDEDDRDSIMIQEAIWEIFKTERSYMNGVQNIFLPLPANFVDRKFVQFVRYRSYRRRAGF